MKWLPLNQVNLVTSQCLGVEWSIYGNPPRGRFHFNNLLLLRDLINSEVKTTIPLLEGCFQRRAGLLIPLILFTPFIKSVLGDQITNRIELTTNSIVTNNTGPVGGVLTLHTVYAGPPANMPFCISSICFSNSAWVVGLLMQINIKCFCKMFAAFSS